MGAKARRLAGFKAQHPYCCLCGGSVATETIEHAPPKIMFFGSHRPKGLEVPACQRCNNGSSQQDQFAALLACAQSESLIYNGDNATTAAKHFQKLVGGVGNNSSIGPIFDVDTDVWLRSRGILQRFKKLKIKPAAFTQYLDLWAAKQALAIWYEQTKTIFSEKGTITILWMNPETINRSEDVQKFLTNLPISGRLVQGSFDTADQFFYKLGISDDQTVGIYWPVFHNTFTFIALFEIDTDKRPKLADKDIRKGVVLRTHPNRGIFIENADIFSAQRRTSN